MKTALAALLALGLLSGAANAKSQSLFTDIQRTAPKSVFDDLATSAPRSLFDDIRNSAPRSVFDDLSASAPRSDGVFGKLQRNAP